MFCSVCIWKVRSFLYLVSVRNENAPMLVAAAARGQRIVLGALTGGDIAAQPARSLERLRMGRMPDVHAPKMRAVRVRVTHTLDNRHLALVVQRLQLAQVGVQADR